MSAVTIRDMRTEDVAEAWAIECAAFPDPWTLRVFAEELAALDRAYVVAEDDGAVVGFAGTMVVGEDAHLMNLAVGESRRGQGIGRRLLEAVADRATGLGARRITLEVRPENESAVALYRSAGLVEVGVRPGYYPGGQDAMIMWGELPLSTVVVDDGNSGELILAIESSCDETAAAVMRGGGELLANVVASQIDFHARFGGVVPEIASRKHTEAIVGVIDEAMRRAGESLGRDRLDFEDLDAIAVTYGPGLVGALVVGLAYAKGLAMATGLPLVGVNHLEGHIFANVFADPAVRPPLVALLVSGGHTSLVHMPEWGVYRTMGETLDDATGEAFDKVAKVLGLGYPGGPVLSKLAETGDPAAIDFPRAMMRSGDYSFSLSGLKTAVINHIRHEQRGRSGHRPSRPCRVLPAGGDRRPGRQGGPGGRRDRRHGVLPRGRGGGQPGVARGAGHRDRRAGSARECPPAAPLHRQRRHDRRRCPLPVSARGSARSGCRARAGSQTGYLRNLSVRLSHLFTKSSSDGLAVLGKHRYNRLC